MTVTATPSDPALQPVSISYVLSFAEYRAGFSAHTRNTLLRTMLIQLILMSAALTWAQWITRGYFLHTIFAWIALGLVVLSLAMVPYRFNRAFRRVYAGRFGGEETTARFDEAGFHLQTQTLSTSIRWNGLTHYEVKHGRGKRGGGKRGLLVVYRTVRLPFVLPRRAFVDEREFQTALRWCESRIGYESEQRGFEVKVC